MANCPGCRKRGWPAPSGPKNCCPCRWLEKARPGRWPALRGDTLSVCTTSGARLGSLPSPTSLRPSSFLRASARSFSRLRRLNGPSPPPSVDSLLPLSGLRRSRERSASVKRAGLASREGLGPRGPAARSSAGRSGSGSLSAAHGFSSATGREEARVIGTPPETDAAPSPRENLNLVTATLARPAVGKVKLGELGAAAGHINQDPILTLEENEPWRRKLISDHITHKGSSSKFFQMSWLPGTVLIREYQIGSPSHIPITFIQAFEISRSLNKRPTLRGTLRGHVLGPSLQTRSALSLTSGPVQAQGAGRCVGGGRWFTRRGRLAGGGIGFSAITLRLTVLLIQTESGQR